MPFHLLGRRETVSASGLVSGFNSGDQNCDVVSRPDEMKGGSNYVPQG